MALFTPSERGELRMRLIEHARSDNRVTGAALTGSAARGEEDRWSDIDLFLGISAAAGLDEVLAEWTNVMHVEEGAVHHWDVPSGDAVYRVFLLGNGLQVDIAFTPESSFGARGPSFSVLFGNPVDVPASAPQTSADMAVLGLLGVLHAHKAIERGRPWEAEYWISTVRDQTLSLACLRLGESPAYARGVDRLPKAATSPLGEALVASLEPVELRRALSVAATCLLGEIRLADPELGDRIEGPLLSLAGG